MKIRVLNCVLVVSTRKSVTKLIKKSDFLKIKPSTDKGFIHNIELFVMFCTGWLIVRF